MIFHPRQKKINVNIPLAMENTIINQVVETKLTAPENTITYHNALCLTSQIFYKHCFEFLLGVKMAPRETENNACANFLRDKQRALWCVMVFSVVVNS